MRAPSEEICGLLMQSVIRSHRADRESKNTRRGTNSKDTLGFHPAQMRKSRADSDRYAFHAVSIWSQVFFLKLYQPTDVVSSWAHLGGGMKAMGKKPRMNIRSEVTLFLVFCLELHCPLDHLRRMDTPIAAKSD